MNVPGNIKNVYFLGIGGIGMSALARYFKYMGKNVAGYDSTRTALTDTLQSEGIDVHYEDDIRKIPSNWNPHETLAVFTPALPDDHNELSWFREKPISLLKRAKVLGMVCNEKDCIAVAGSHGKTTVSTMTANILSKTEAGCGAFLGGISKNFGSNILLPKEDSSWIIAEADEFDRSFLNLFPKIAVVTSTDADHLDIYGRKERMIESFEKFISQIREGGSLVIKKGVVLNVENTEIVKYTYSINDDRADFYPVGLKLSKEDRSYIFDLRTPEGVIQGCKLVYPGLVNVENAVAASAAASLAGAGAGEIRAGLESYRGVVRRFEVRYKDEKSLYIDDYAHHPEELSAMITSVKALYPGRKITGIFQPHLFTRTRDFVEEFAASLDLLDETILVPIYSAREEPIPGVTSKLILSKMNSDNKFFAEMPEVANLLKEHSTDIVLTIGAGNIDSLAVEITEVLKSK